MSTRQQISDGEKKQLELDQQRLDEYTQKYKGPVLSLQTQCSQLIPNVIDQLIATCVELHKRVDIMTSKKEKVEAELATLKAVANSDKKKGNGPVKQEQVPVCAPGSTPKPTEKQT